jgi:hypothetical protein
MRRYGRTAPRVVVPGRDGGLSLVMRVNDPPSATCAPTVSGLFWWSDASADFDETAEAAQLLAAGIAAGPVLAVAGLIGETCGEPVLWQTAWAPAGEGDGAPGVREDGARLLVYPAADTGAGTLEVSAVFAGQNHGPILLGISIAE